eukprot:2730887-Amphidinium_carterae.2
MEMTRTKHCQSNLKRKCKFHVACAEEGHRTSTTKPIVTKQSSSAEEYLSVLMRKLCAESATLRCSRVAFRGARVTAELYSWTTRTITSTTHAPLAHYFKIVGWQRLSNVYNSFQYAIARSARLFAASGCLAIYSQWTIASPQELAKSEKFPFPGDRQVMRFETEGVATQDPAN